MPKDTDTADPAATAIKVFTGASDPNLPSNVQDLSLEKRQQWVGAWNGRFKQCRDDGRTVKDCEGSAFAVANAAIKAALPPDEGDAFAAKCSYEQSYWFEKIGQDEAAYDPIGSTDTKACANCRWFINPNNCAIVDNWPRPITPNGLSNRWEETVEDRVFEPDPIPVIIVGEGTAELNDESEDGDKAATKSEASVDFPAADFAVVPDAQKPSTWKLRLAEDRPGNITVARVGRAITALQPSGFRGPRVQLTSEQKTGAVRRISGAIRVLSATPDQKSNLRERLDAVKSRTLQVDIPQRLLATVKAGILGLLKRDDDQQKSFVLFKDNDGNLRWFAWASNRWRDHDNPPEIISEKAHQDYVGYLDRTGNYPEAWLWHTPGTKWGQADWADYADGFLVVSGTVDAGREHIADALAAQKDLGVSHGFMYRHDDPEQGIIGWYRSFEVSPLPVDAAANPWTSLEVLNKEADMGFSDKKRTWLVGQLGEAEVARLEGDTDAMKSALVAKGVDFKDAPADEGDDKDKTPSTPPADDGEANKALVTTVAEAAVKAVIESDAFKGLTVSQAALTASVKGLSDRLDALERTDDQKIAAQVGARDHKPNGHVASRDDKNVVGEKEDIPEGPTFFDAIMEDLEIEAPKA